MRLLMTNVLVAGMLLFGAASASAYAINMTTSYGGQVLGVSDTITVDVWLDTQGQSNILLVTVGILYDQNQLTYMAASPGQGLLYTAPAGSGLSDANNYPLYAPAAGRGNPSTWLAPAIPFGGTSYNPPQIIVPGQVNVDQHANGLVPTTAISANEHLATLIFHVTNPTANSTLQLTMSQGGTVFQLGDNSNPTVGLSAPINVVVPEPTTALLIGLGLVGLGVAGRRRE